VQLLARASGAWVGRLPDGPEIGWCRVVLTEEGIDDPVLGSLPRVFDALQWHHYTYGVPAGAVELARSDACTQAFRLGDACWGVQFHPEVTAAQVEGWAADTDDPPPDPARLRTETAERIAQWNEHGRGLCAAFLETAGSLASSKLQSASRP
jgi:GMP synthase (glutamine-hydrolysing)